MSDAEYVSSTLRESVMMANEPHGLWQAYLGFTGSSGVNSSSIIQSAEFGPLQSGTDRNRMAILSAVRE